MLKWQQVITTFECLSSSWTVQLRNRVLQKGTDYQDQNFGKEHCESTTSYNNLGNVDQAFGQ